ncbi:MAG TPA: biosynthetic-type acetolactate synthase large subunit [Chloroflexi bacterium]|jgi:acetolactate synthase-1/2/3 large subunit|nr:biosynthetic-type acetolactate synthase large subunit [Chloroflexota bacterium]
MRLNGAQILWECLIREGVEVVFGITGGQIMPVYHEMSNYPAIRHVTVRHEQAAAHAADGYARATGRVGVCLATSGPGATNLVTGIATAQMDSSPIVAITGQVPSSMLGIDSFQEVDITGITMPITKHNYLITDVNDLAWAVKEAFYIARSGRPGPVLIDIARNAQIAETNFEYPTEINLPGYKPHLHGNMRQVRQAAEMINGARRPLIVAGRGIIISRAQDELRELAEKAQIPVVTTLLGKSALPETHPLCLGMGGMHGEAYTNLALQAADLIIGIGTRFDDRLTSTLAHTFAPNARVIHIDLDPAEIGKRVRVDLPIVGDARNVLGALVPLVDYAAHTDWTAHIDRWREDTQARDILWQETDELVPQYVVRSIWEATEGEAIMVSDVGQNQMWEAQYYLHNRFGGLITSGGLGTMGFSLPAAMGAALGQPDVPVWVVAGDGGFQMNCQELATIVQERLPIKIAVLNNGFLGMVRQWQELFFQGNYSGTPILGPDFVKLAAAYGIPGITVDDKAHVGEAIRQAQETDGPVLLDFRIEREHNVFPIVPLGQSIDNMIRRPRVGEPGE